MQYVDQLELSGKKVFIRCDLNVPLDNNGNIADDMRIRAALPTISFARGAGAKVILASHLGRPKGKRVEEFSLRPVAKRLSELLNTEVKLAPDCIGDEVKALVEKLGPQDVLLLENLRFHEGETNNDLDYAKELAMLADVYVNDAFGTAHRAHASTAGITNFIKEKAGGFTMKKEMDYFTKAFDNPERPLVAIFGGAKISTKMAAIKHVAKTADKIIVGGAMANTFIAADGHEIGKSLYEADEFSAITDIRGAVANSGCELLLPTDFVVAQEFKAGVDTAVVGVAGISSSQMALDIGPETLESFKSALNDAKTIVWNGPMGAFEIDEFSSGTYGIVDALCQSKALTVVGGGDTDLALHNRHAFDKVDYVSTGGGAFLKLLEGAELPAIKALS